MVSSIPSPSDCILSDTLSAHLDTRIVSGDILHVETLCKDHFGEYNNIVYSFAEQYFKEKLDELTLEIEENQNSYKRRTSSDAKSKAELTDDVDLQSVSAQQSSEQHQTVRHTRMPSFSLSNELSQEQSKWKNSKVRFKVIVSCTHQLMQLKEIVSAKIGVPSRCIRLYAKVTIRVSFRRSLSSLRRHAIE